MNKYDVVIIGGGTSGCACAWNCARLGLKTLLLEKNIHLGGAMTSGLVIPAMKSGDNLINTDFYNNLIQEMKNIGGHVTYQDNPGWFNPELLKIALETLINGAGADVLLSVKNITPIFYEEKCCDSNVKGLVLSEYNDVIHSDNVEMIEHDNLSVYIESKYYVDGTGDGNFCKKIGCNFLENDEFQPMSLRFIIGGIDVKKFAEWLLNIDSDRDVTTVEVIDGITHLSTACTWDTNRNWALAPLFQSATNEGLLKSEDWNYFQLFTIAGMPDSIAFNCPRITENLNPSCLYDRTKVLMSAKTSILRLSKFCKKYFPGFENSYISNIADSIGIRVSNRIKGKYVYSIEDLRSGRTFKNPALISNYPVDVHSCNKNSSTLELNSEYQLPVESLITDKFDNVFAIGRCLSADFMSQGALRVQGSCFSMGEAVAKYIKAKSDELF